MRCVRAGRACSSHMDRTWLGYRVQTFLFPLLGCRFLLALLPGLQSFVFRAINLVYAAQWSTSAILRLVSLLRSSCAANFL